MRECMCLNIGQAGVQMGNAIWELFCLEHAVNMDGTKEDGSVAYLDYDASNRIFYQSEYDKVVPRVLYVDLEPTVIDEIRTGPYRQLFHPTDLVTGKEDAASNYARARFTLGKEMIGVVEDALHKQIENCDNLEGFFIFHSFGGGTGSGFTNLFMQKIMDEYRKKARINCSIYPSPQIANAIVEPYNAILSLKNNVEQSECTFIADNEALYDVSGRNLGCDQPTFTTVNRILSQIISGLTTPIRFPSASSSCDLTTFQTNLVPYPRIHFPLLAHVPLLSPHKAYHEKINAVEMTKLVFLPCSQVMKCHPVHGRYMSCILFFRGDVTPRDANEALYLIKRKPYIRFVDWCPCGFKVNICDRGPTQVPGSGIAPTKLSITVSANSTAISEAFARLNHKFDVMHFKRAFIHWFVGEGMEEGEFQEAREEIRTLEDDYEMVGQDTEALNGEGNDSPKKPSTKKSTEYRSSFDQNQDEQNQDEQNQDEQNQDDENQGDQNEDYQNQFEENQYEQNDQNQDDQNEADENQYGQNEDYQNQYDDNYGQVDSGQEQAQDNEYETDPEEQVVYTPSEEETHVTEQSSRVEED